MATADLNQVFGWPYSDENGVDAELIVGGEYLDEDTDEIQVSPDSSNTIFPRPRPPC